MSKLLTVLSPREQTKIIPKYWAEEIAAEYKSYSPHAQTTSATILEIQGISSNFNLFVPLVLKPVGCQPWAEQC